MAGNLRPLRRLRRLRQWGFLTHLSTLQIPLK